MHYNKLSDLLRPSLGIKTKERVMQSDRISKYGGIPDLPKHFEWPTFAGKPLSFICQLNLSELPAHLFSEDLPPGGILYFFILTEGVENRFPVEKGEYVVRFVEPGANLSVRENEAPRGKVFKEVALDFYKHFTFPSYQSYLRRNETEELEYIIENLKDEISLLTDSASEIETRHQILGNPQALQGTVTYWWAHKSLGLKDSELDQSLKNLLHTEEKRYELLLQLDFSDEKTNFSEFGGDAIAYFGILKEDLSKGDFSNVSLVIQNT